MFDGNACWSIKRPRGVSTAGVDAGFGVEFKCCCACLFLVLGLACGTVEVMMMLAEDE